MNRAERRRQEKWLRKIGLNKVQAKREADRMKDDPLKEGQKVKLNYELMVRRPEWKEQEEDFRKWVEENRNKIFTVEYEPTRKQTDAPDKMINVNFVEDASDPKWLLHTNTLIPVPTATIKLNDGTETVVGLDGINDINDSKISEIINEAMEEHDDSGN